MQTRHHNSSPYDLLVQTASALTEPDWCKWTDDPSDKTVADFLATNQTALKAARAALKLDCRMEVRFEEAFFAEHRELRKLTTVLGVELEVASKRDFDAAIDIAIELWRLAAVSRNGGIVTDQLTSNCIASIAVGHLRKIRLELNQPQRQRLISAIQLAEAEFELFDRIVARDELWETRVGWKDVPVDMEEVHATLDETMDEDTTDEIERWIRESVTLMLQRTPDVKNYMNQSLDNRMFAMMRMFLIELGLQSILEATGQYPQDLDSLSPEFLNPVPLDPFSGMPFVYRRETSDKFCLYTPGPTQRDHGGTFGAWDEVAAGMADLCLDADDYWDD